MKILFVCLFLTICTHAFCQIKTSGSGNYNSVGLPKDDSTFLALKDTAQAHLQTFIDSVKIHGRDTMNYEFMIKSEFVENDDHEHMWSLILSYDKGNFKGIFIDSAFDIKNIKTGDKISIKRADVEDWSFYNKITGKKMGYYSEMYLEEKRK